MFTNMFSPNLSSGKCLCEEQGVMITAEELKWSDRSRSRISLPRFFSSRICGRSSHWNI